MSIVPINVPIDVVENRIRISSNTTMSNSASADGGGDDHMSKPFLGMFLFT